jgi:hypothetical protein
MKRPLVFVLLILFLAVTSAGVLAQETPSNPAAYLPGDLAAYLELRSDDAGTAALNQLTSLGLGMSGIPAAQSDAIALLVTPALNSLFPGIDARADVLPWLGDRIGAGVLHTSGMPDSPAGETIFVLPVRDADAAAAFVGKVTNGAAKQSVGGVSVYKTDRFGLAVGSGVMWLSSPQGIDALLAAPMLERLSDNAGYRKVRAALPADAVLTGYLGGGFLMDMLAQTESLMPEGQPTYGMIVQAALRIHPAKSAAKDALLAAKGVDGIGFALVAASDRLDLTAVLSVDAQYPAPTLTNATAGTALLSLIPNNSFLVFDSYDVSVTTLPILALAYLGPVVGSTFNSVVASLETGDILTPRPTPSPTPTPTPLPVSVESLIAQAQPAIQQIESFMGMSLEQLYALTDGEYALAVFPGPGPTLGAALYLQSNDPQKLIDTVDRVSKVFLTDPATGARVINVEHQTVDGIDVALLGDAGAGDRPALGVVNPDVLFLTNESSISTVISAAKASASTTPALAWRDSFGDSQEALLYLEPRTLDLYMLRQQRQPPLPATALAGSFDARANGLFVLRLAVTLAAS